jgi:uncharacterized FAD-dependent dehydrogenase
VDDIEVTSSSSQTGEGEGEGVKRISGLRLRDGSVLDADLVVMAPGHSARVLYEKLIEKGVSIEPKPIAVSAAPYCTSHHCSLYLSASLFHYFSHPISHF